MTPQAKTRKYKRMSLREAERVRVLLETSIGRKVSMDLTEGMTARYESRGKAIYVDGGSWMDFYVGLSMVAEVIEFVTD